MIRRHRRIQVELALAGLSAVLAIVALLWPDWMESVTGGGGGDGGSGLLEWALAGGAALAAVGFALAARAERRRGLRPSRPESAS